MRYLAFQATRSISTGWRVPPEGYLHERRNRRGLFRKSDCIPPVSCINASLESFVHCMLIIEQEVLDNEVPEDLNNIASLSIDLVNSITLIEERVLTEPAGFWQQVIEFYLQELAE
ncbi:hypothetical protein NKH18_26970 [Streptomyces sp. M10(2022)]